jgi:hypothetical protein
MTGLVVARERPGGGVYAEVVGPVILDQERTVVAHDLEHGPRASQRPLGSGGVGVLRFHVRRAPVSRRARSSWSGSGPSASLVTGTGRTPAWCAARIAPQYVGDSSSSGCPGASKARKVEVRALWLPGTITTFVAVGADRPAGVSPPTSLANQVLSWVGGWRLSVSTERAHDDDPPPAERASLTHVRGVTDRGVALGLFGSYGCPGVF